MRGSKAKLLIQATEMIYNIRNEFIKILKEVDWMDTESKAVALEKADKMDIKIGYPDYIYNDTYLEELYKEVRHTSVLSFAFSLQRFYFDRVSLSTCSKRRSSSRTIYS